MILKYPSHSRDVNQHIMGKVTIKDIAARLNTSPKTVSKALNNQPGVSNALREQIKKKARELNYVPNVFGRGLSGKPLRTIGIILPENANPVYFLFLNGLEEKAAESDYDIILGISHEDLDREKKLIRVLLEKHVDGVIISPVHPEGNHNIEILQHLEIPYILINRSIPHQNHVCIKANSALGAYLAGQYLLQKGHSNLLHLTRKYSVSSVEDRIAGLQRIFREHNVPFQEENIYRRCEVSVESAYTEMLEILRERRDFTVVFAYNDIIAFGVMKAIHECRLRIPMDIAIMGFDNMMFADICLVPLTTVNQDLFAIGSIAMEVLLKKIHGDYEGQYPVVPEPYIVERQSV